jgi:hypothetical protein
MAVKICKHQWRYLDKRVILDSLTGKPEKTIYVFFCLKCLRFRRVSSQELSVKKIQ